VKRLSKSLSKHWLTSGFRLSQRRSHERDDGELARKIDSAGNLQSVVRTMKALAASSIGQFEQSGRALTDYYSAVELGLGVCFGKKGRRR